jgi:hypothetical protein
VAYDGVVAAGQLTGGSMVLEPSDADLGKPRSSIAVFSILRNTEEYLELDNKVQAPAGFDPLAALVPGAVVYATNADGTVPVFVQFDVQRGLNELAGASLFSSEDDADGTIENYAPCFAVGGRAPDVPARGFYARGLCGEKIVIGHHRVAGKLS